MVKATIVDSADEVNFLFERKLSGALASARASMAGVGTEGV